MDEEKQQALRCVLSIGHDTSMRGEGISLRDALRRTNYRELRSSFDVVDLLPYIQQTPILARQWLMYSEDKRTDGGWWIIDSPPSVGRVFKPELTEVFQSLEEAVAAYVIRELDYWAKIQ
jgi:hypothetical protein